ncbi:MAG: ATP-binding protein [Actinomycetota bacterium]
MGLRATDLLRGYSTMLFVGVAALLVATALAPGSFDDYIWQWVLLSALFGFAEGVDLFFHHERGRQSLAAGEAVFIPMVVVLSFGQMVWGVTIAMALIAWFYWRVRGVKWLFNVGNHGLAVALGAGVWSLWADAGATLLTPRNAVVAVAATAVQQLANHAFVAGALALAEGARYLKLLKEIIAPTLPKLAGTFSLGLLFAAAFMAEQWTALLFPAPLAALYLGYRAVLRQGRERERVESLHAASRALAISPALEGALIGFLRAVCAVVSSVEARVVVNVNRHWYASAVHGDEVISNMELVEGGTTLTLLERFRTDPVALVVSTDERSENQDLLDGVDARSLIGVPLMNGPEFAGCLVATNRVGAEEFSDSDAKLLEALGNELVLTLDSYRLFAQVKEERERFQQIFAGSKEGICLLDEDGFIRAWNPALARITGFQEDEIIGELWSERVLVRDRYHRRIEGMDIVSVPPDEELEIVTRQGPPRWVAIISGEVPTEDKKSWVLLVRDITAEHELEESKSDFLSTISHELRTPLTTIKGSLQVLSRPNASANSEIGKQMVEIMRRGSDRLERLVMNLLAVSQMEAGDVQVYPDEVALEDLVRRRIDSVLPDHPQVEVLIEEDVAVRADRERLAQVVEHLLDNARKFGPESGLIRVEIAKENGYARLSVTDEGPGIPKIDQERIFDRFVRLGHVLTRETQGPGVGLFIVKRSIEAMGGSVEVESEPGHGTTFHLRIPLAFPMAAIDSAS